MSINVAENNANYKSIDGVLYSKDGARLISCPAGKSAFVIPEEMTDIERDAFYGNDKLNSIEVDNNNNIYSSVDGVLYSKDGKTLIYCPNGKAHFSIPAGVATIEENAFENCSDLLSVEVPESVTSIESTVFGECSSLVDIGVNTNNSRYLSINGVLYSKDGKQLICCPPGKENVAIPDGVREIVDGAFMHCKNLLSVEIPESVNSIWEFFEGWTFQYSEKLTISCIKGSVAESYAIKRNIPYKYIEKTSGGTVSPEVNPTEIPTITQTNVPTDTPKLTQAPVKQEAQKITAKNITKTYGAKAFSIGAQTNGNGKLTYTSGDKKVVTVSDNGKVTIKGCGKTTITIKAAETSEYKAAEKKITITIKPKQQKVSSVKSTAAKSITVKWKKDKKATGYILQYSTDKKFKKNVKTVTVSNNKTTSKKISKLKAGKKYYVRICSYKKSSGTKIKGNYSSIKSVKVKK